MDNKVYLTIKEKVVIYVDEDIYLKDISDIYCEDPKLLIKLQNIKIQKGYDEENWDVMDIKMVTEKILQKYPDLDLNFHGAIDILIEIKSKEEVNNLFELIKIIMVSLVLFLGAGMGIMYFHEDVNMAVTMEKLYYAFTGERSSNSLWITIPYSIGLGTGMITFFNRIMSKSKRRKKEPGPMDVSLYQYDKDQESYILDQLKGDKKE